MASRPSYSSRRALRSPFVITVATVATALAVGSGCGGRAIDTREESDPAKTDVASPSGSGEHMGSGGYDCMSLPSAGQPCTAGSTCMPTSRCEGGRYVYEGVACIGGNWSPTVSLGGECRTPCPKKKPPIGDACGPIYEKCSYVIGCSALPAATDDVVECRDGIWRPLGTYTMWCPREQPVNGASCADCAGHFPESCDYGDCSGAPTASASCDTRTGRWKVATRSCNPPPPPLDGGSLDGAR